MRPAYFRLSALLPTAMLLAGCAADPGDATQPGTDEFLEQVSAEHKGDVPVAGAAHGFGDAVPEVFAESIIYGELDGEPLGAYVAWPGDYGAARPAVLVIHEWWGLNDNIKEMSRHLAARGYLAMAVDLYGGQVAEDAAAARALVSAARKDPARIDRILQSAYAFLREQGGASKVASVGWCFGGGISLRTAMLLPDELDAAVVYYGRLVDDPGQLRTLQVPILGIFAELDSSIPPAAVQRFEETLDELGKDAQIYVYEGVDHAFANPSGTRYDAAAAADAWHRTLQFLDTHLQ